MSQIQHGEYAGEEEDSNSIGASSELSFEEIDNKNAKQNEQRDLKVALLEAKLLIVKAANDKLLEETLKDFEEKAKLREENQIQAKKCDELEARIRNILTKVKNLGITDQNCWNQSKTKATISSNGLQAKTSRSRENVFATKGFPIPLVDGHNNAWTMYYYEVTQMSQYGFGFWVGLSNGDLLRDSAVGWAQNTYSIPRGCDFYINSEIGHDFEWADGAIKPGWKGLGDVVGCGLLIGPNDKMSLFFTLNGIILGRQMPIAHKQGNHLFPTVTIWDMTLEANFGDDLAAKPFKYDLDTCPGLDLV